MGLKTELPTLPPKLQAIIDARGDELLTDDTQVVTEHDDDLTMGTRVMRGLGRGLRKAAPTFLQLAMHKTIGEFVKHDTGQPSWQGSAYTEENKPDPNDELESEILKAYGQEEIESNVDLRKRIKSVGGIEKLHEWEEQGGVGGILGMEEWIKNAFKKDKESALNASNSWAIGDLHEENDLRIPEAKSSDQQSTMHGNTLWRYYNRHIGEYNKRGPDGEMGPKLNELVMSFSEGLNLLGKNFVYDRDKQLVEVPLPSAHYFSIAEAVPEAKKALDIWLQAYNIGFGITKPQYIKKDGKLYVRQKTPAVEGKQQDDLKLVSNPEIYTREKTRSTTDVLRKDEDEVVGAVDSQFLYIMHQENADITDVQSFFRESEYNSTLLDRKNNFLMAHHVSKSWDTRNKKTSLMKFAYFVAKKHGKWDPVKKKWDLSLINEKDIITMLKDGVIPDYWRQQGNRLVKIKPYVKTELNNAALKDSKGLRLNMNSAISVGSQIEALHLETLEGEDPVTAAPRMAKSIILWFGRYGGLNEIAQVLQPEFLKKGFKLDLGRVDKKSAGSKTFTEAIDEVLDLKYEGETSTPEGKQLALYFEDVREELTKAKEHYKEGKIGEFRLDSKQEEKVNGFLRKMKSTDPAIRQRAKGDLDNFLKNNKELVSNIRIANARTLGVMYAFQAAVALQGGATGRAVSDQDRKEAKAAIGDLMSGNTAKILSSTNTLQKFLKKIRREVEIDIQAGGRGTQEKVSSMMEGVKEYLNNDSLSYVKTQLDNFGTSDDKYGNFHTSLNNYKDI